MIRGPFNEDGRLLLSLSGFDLYLVGLYVDIKYLLWRSTWDMTEEEDYILGISQ